MKTEEILTFGERWLPLWSGKRARRALETLADSEKSKIDKLIAIRGAVAHRRPTMEALIRWVDEAIETERAREAGR